MLYDPCSLGTLHFSILKPCIYVITGLFSMPNYKGPSIGTVVLLGTVPGVYSCSIPIYWMDEWMNGQDQVKSSWTILLVTTRGQCPTTNCPPLAGRPDRRASVPTPTQPLKRGGQTAEAMPHSAALGALAHTQHADAQHEGVHSIGHDSRPPPGRAGRRHHLFWLSFLAFHLQ